MRTSTISLFILAPVFTLTVGCDDPEFGMEGDGVAFRCSTTNCGTGGLGNTSRIGDHALSNMSEALGADAANHTASIRITGGTAHYGGTNVALSQIDVEADGELKLRLPSGGWIGGTAVKNAVFDLMVVPNDPGEPAFTGQLKIVDARCEAGLYDPTMTICRYQFVTDVEPGDTDLYPMHERYAGWYHTCPDEDELGDGYNFSSVLSPNVSLSFSDATGPRIDPAPGTFINGCLNGAVSKGQYRLNAFYDSTAYRGLQPSQRTPMLLLWMAWHAGESRTEPGKLVSPHDPLGGLFTWTGDSDWGVEGGYGASGATCRGGAPATGLHRKYVDPVASLAGWSSLPHCTESTLDDYAVLGVKVQLPDAP